MRSHGGARCSEQPLLERRETPTNPAKGGGPNQLRLQEQRMKAAPHHYYCFIFSSFFLRFWVAGAWRLRYASSFCLHFFFMFSSFFLHLCWRSGPKGREPGGGCWRGGEGRGRGGGEAKTRSLFILFIFLHFIFIFSSHFFFILFHFFFSFFLHFIFIFSSFFLHSCHHFFFIFEVSQPQIFIFSSFRFHFPWRSSPKSSFFLHFSSRRP